MCCWLKNSMLVEHKYEAGEDVTYNDQTALVTEVYPVKEGKAEYTIFINGESVRVEEDDIAPIEVDAHDFVTR